MRRRYSLRHIFQLIELITVNEWEQHRSQAERNVHLFRMLIDHMYGGDSEDSDIHPEKIEEETQSGATVQQEEEALKKLLASRQTEQHQIESYEKLQRSLQHQEEKRAKENR